VNWTQARQREGFGTRQGKLVGKQRMCLMLSIEIKQVNRRNILFRGNEFSLVTLLIIGLQAKII
jgi:hypothetical protein